MSTKIDKCRICGNKNLVSVLNLGKQYLTGIFPKDKSQKIASGPLELVKCFNVNKNDCCGLLQLSYTYNLNDMYGHNYGYRSGLNQSMIKHLHGKVKRIQESIDLSNGDLIIDIGSNDSTLLQGYTRKDLILAGIDPTGVKFKKYYPEHIRLISDFFSAEIVKENFYNKKAKVITSIAMFYDLESPMDFMKQVYDILAEDGIWVFEQSYMPAMLKMTAYDTICHEHLEYYGLKQIKWMADKIGFKIIDVEFNNVNGGSFSIAVAKTNSPYRENIPLVDKILSEENSGGLGELNIYDDFANRVYKHREDLIRFIKNARSEDRKILGYGASTKGNVILQFCNLTEKDIPFIAEVNTDKFGCYAPGTCIPIIPEEEARAMRPDYFLVLPWHFKENIIDKEKHYLMSGGKLLFPLPKMEITDKGLNFNE